MMRTWSLQIFPTSVEKEDFLGNNDNTSLAESCQGISVWINNPTFPLHHSGVGLRDYQRSFDQFFSGLPANAYAGR